MTLQTTPLNATHRAMGARMVDFGGWDMPVNYGSQIEEHHAVRSDAGMFDVSHMCVVDIKGANVRAFLRGLLANNVDKLQVQGKALYSCMLNERGTVIDDLIVYYFAEDWFRLVVNAGTAEKDLAWIRKQNDATGSSLSIVERRSGKEGPAMALVAVQGPNARAKVWQVAPGTEAASKDMKPFNAVIVNDTPFGEMMVARTGYTGEDGFEVAVAADQADKLWNALAAAGVKPAGLGARDTLRLEAGMNLYGQDMDEETNPLDAGLGWTIDLVSERDFIGKAALQANGQTQQYVGLILRDKGGVLRAHQKIICGEQTGEITSGTFSPTMQQAIALARVPVGVNVGDTVQVEIRDKRLAASVVKLPFVRNGKILAA